MNKEKRMPPELLHEMQALDATEATELTRVWEMLEAARPEASKDVIDASWSGLQRSLVSEHADAPVVSVSPTRGPLRLFNKSAAVFAHPAVTRWAAAAAVVLVAVGSVFGLRATTYTTSAGEQLVVELRDGSEVALNADSRLVGSSFFGRLFDSSSSRRYNLTGEGFFDVMAGENPFVVETHNATVTVVGTRFDVRSYRDGFDDATELAVEEGVVNFAGKQANANAPVVVAAGMMSSVGVSHLSPSEPSTANIERATAWQRQALSIVDKPLGSVIAEIERRYAIKIRVVGDIDLSSLKTLYYSADRSAESIIADLAQSGGFTYRPIRNGYELVGAR